VSRNMRANSTNPNRPSLNNTFHQQPQIGFDTQGKAAQGVPLKNNKYVNNGASYLQQTAPFSSMQPQAPVSPADTIKRIRDSRQRANKSIPMGSSDPQNQLMQAYINSTVTASQKTSGFVAPSGQIRATEPMRIRAHSDLKKTGIQIGVKIQGVQNSRKQLNQTTILAGNPQNTQLSQGIQ